VGHAGGGRAARRARAGAAVAATIARALLAAAVAAPGLAAAREDGPLPPGAARVDLRLDGVAEPLTVFTYRPPAYGDGPLIVVLHGSSRDADVYRDRARVLGDRFGALIVAPRFDRRRFPGSRYPGGPGLVRRADPAGEPVFVLLERLVATVRRREGRATLPCYVIGHSAGGRAVLLLAAFAHLDAVRFVAANPSAPLWPTPRVRFPRGYGGLPARLANEVARRRYLERPLTLYLGAADSTRDRQAPARFEEARAEAARRGWRCGWSLVTVPRVGHRSAEMLRRPEVAEALFGRAGPASENGRD
jgi:poly(3-hydroxybutyrate) depolymerase